MGVTCILPKDCREKKLSFKAKTIKFEDFEYCKSNKGSTNNLLAANKLLKEEENNKNNNYENIEKAKLKPFYEKYFSKAEENFSYNLLKEINQLRTNPTNYAKKIEDFAMNIKTNYFSKENYFLFQNFPIYLKEGEKEFIECSNYLKNTKNGNENLPDFEYIADLKIPFPEDMDNWDDKDYINSEMEEFEKENKGKYDLVEFVYIKIVKNAEISAILSLFNEDKKSKNIRNYIFMKEMKYIGINYEIIDEIYIGLYLVFAK